MALARIWFAALAALAAVPCQAGVVQGVVLDNFSGRPLARAMVTLTPVPGTQFGTELVQVKTMRAGIGGTFSFATTAGQYLLMATREAYYPAAYGSRKPQGKAMPIEVTRDSSLFAELRMRRRGGVTGRVLDENGVAMAGIPVLAYRARLPLRSAGQAVSDDRGIYRIGGLLPGRYWVRTGAQRLEDTSTWLPTFGPGSRESSSAKVHTVKVDTDAEFADVSPEPGLLFSLSGTISCDTLEPVTIRLSSETGQRSATGACGGAYRFDALAPASYEVAAITANGGHSGFVELFVDRDSESGGVQALESPAVTIDTILQAGTRMRGQVKVFARRQDMSETGVETELTKNPMVLPAGYWEFRAVPPAGYAVDNIRVGNFNRQRPARAVTTPNGFEIFLPVKQPSRVTVVLTDKVGRVAGTVRDEGKTRSGVPVYLVPGASIRRALGGVKETVSDTNGGYHFDDLPPGDYRVVASFDMSDVDEELGEVRDLKVTGVEAGKTTTADLTVWVSPGF